MSRSFLLFLSAALCGAGAILVAEPAAEALLDTESARLQGRILEAQAELEAFTGENARELASLGGREWMREHAEALSETHRERGLSIVAFSKDSLIAWSGNALFTTDRTRALIGSQARLSEHVLLHCSVGVGALVVHGVREIWSVPAVRNRYLRPRFHSSLGAPDGLLGESDGHADHVIHDAEGRALVRLAWSEGAIEMGPWLMWRAVLLALAVILVMASIWAACMGLVRRGHAVLGAAAFIAAAVLLRWLTLSGETIAPLDRWPLFDPAIYGASAIFPSLGDLLINAVLLLVMAAFLHGATARWRPSASSLAWSASIAFVLGFGAWITNICIGLVDDSSIELDLYHVQGIGVFGALALLAMAVLFGTWGLFASAALALLEKPHRSWRWAAPVLIVLTGSILIHHRAGVVDTLLFLWPVPGMVLLWSRRRKPLGFLHAAFLVGLLAGTSAHILTKYMRNREQRERVVLAEKLAVREDPVVERLFQEKAPALRHDAVVYALLTGSRACPPSTVDSLIRAPYFSGYWDRYDVRLYGFGPAGDLRCATSLDAPRSFRSDTSAIPSGVSEMPGLFIDEVSGAELFYHARIAIMPTDSSPPTQLIVEAQPRSLAHGIGFPELLLAGDDAIARKAQRYARARYVDGLLVERSAHAFQPQHWRSPLEPSGERWYTAGGFEFLAKAVGDRTVMVLGLPQHDIIDRATTFSYLFTLFGLLALLATAGHFVANRKLPSLGIGSKVRAALVLFAILGLVFFGIGSQHLLTRQFEQRAETASLEKARSVQSELQRRIGDEHIANDVHATYLEHICEQLGTTFFTDITVYAPDGRLLASSRPQMFTSGLLGQRMDPVAFARLAIEGAQAFVHDERIGSAAFSTAYAPLLDSRGETLAHIALPRFADQLQQEEERAELLVAVVNLFVLLFALSVLLAVFISNWTTRPLDVLKRALAGVALRGANEPIRYRGRDEVGELVAVYNRKVEELRESAERLARSERESAWREMARQVAHEIKNPLTPMKLGIQLFQRSWDPAAPDAKAKLERFSTSMVQQIDALNGVATAFSQFAQMPSASPADLDLSEVVRAAVDVFHATPGITIAHRESGPLRVRADREHMLRTINNLLKNAVQAIPEGREGRIEVLARSDASYAVVEVRDNGTGILEESRERIFAPSFTTKSSGMGLGLAMVKRMVEQAGGTVRFETTPGEGTSFFVTLPLIAEN
ncbi:MAG: GHKL domain-containing protein [Flavobacteriales bacterium]|nr:GHKL domain-containing protein [Flavobacteriales bacterium]